MHLYIASPSKALICRSCLQPAETASSSLKASFQLSSSFIFIRADDQGEKRGAELVNNMIHVGTIKKLECAAASEAILLN